MRLLLIIIALLLSATAFADGRLIIKDSITSSKTAIPDIMTSSVTVTVTVDDDDFKSVSARIEKAVSIVKSYSGIAEYNSYRINPTYKYLNNERVLTGYTAYLSIPFKFKKIADYNSFLEDINSLNSETNIFKISMSNVSWRLSEDAYESMLHTLKDEIIKLLSLKAVDYSIASEKECSLALIDYTNSNYSAPRLESGSLRSAKINITPPDQSDVKISVSAFYKLICK